MYLAADVGGTKTQLAIYESVDSPLVQPIDSATLPSGEYPSLEALLRAFFANHRYDVQHACLAVAGPVRDCQAKLTNLPWTINGQKLAQQFGWRQVWILNDLAALACAVPHLNRDELVILNSGRPEEHGPIAVMAAGTGLGEAYLTWNGEAYQAHASQGGHSDFAPKNPLQNNLLSYLQQKYEHVSYECVCSGIGLPNIYSFLRDSGFYQEPEWLRQQLKSSRKPTPVIVSAAMNAERTSALCAQAVELFVAILGAAAGNLALKMMATGGVYLGGGIPRYILQPLQNGSFMESFLAKGPMRQVLKDVPVYVLTRSHSPLIGAVSWMAQHQA